MNEEQDAATHHKTYGFHTMNLYKLSDFLSFNIHSKFDLDKV